MRLILATRNQGKLEEVKGIFAGSEIEIIGTKEAGAVGEAEEDGHTFLDNAYKKARFVKKQFPHDWVAADYSGLCVRALGDRPGVHSARWAGEKASTEEITHFLLKEMSHIPVGKRQAYFEMIAVLFSPSDGYDIFSGKVRGEIALQSWGKIRPGMPYDPVFIPDGRDCTFAEMPLEIKNSLSHRAQAFKELRQHLENCQQISLSKNIPH